MKDCYVTFRSITAAQRGESVLRKAGVDVTIQRTPRWMEEQGCGYSLRLDRSEVQSAIARMKSSGVNYRKVYMQQENGAFEEVRI